MERGLLLEMAEVLRMVSSNYKEQQNSYEKSSLILQLPKLVHFAPSSLNQHCRQAVNLASLWLMCHGPKMIYFSS